MATILSNSDNDFARLRQRLHDAIPGGAHTYSRGDDQFPACAPPLLDRGKGAYVWDTQGTRYLDYGMALRAVTIGYADDRVNAAAIAQIEKGVNLTRPSVVELAAAERLCEMIPSAEMVKFAKNGSNVTTAAVKIARAYTGRRFVCVPRQHPFFSFDDWFIGTTPIQRGVDPRQSSSTLVFDYNDFASLARLFDEHSGEIAAVLMEPATHIVPQGSGDPETWPKGGRQAGFLQQVRDLCTRERALFILDEMITGFRWDLHGAQTFFDVEPDLSTFGKAMANGFSLSAITGKREFMRVGSIDEPGMERTFLLSSTHGSEMPALGAFLATARINEEENVSAHLWDYGTRLRSGWIERAIAHGLTDYLQLEGPAVALHFATLGPDGNPSAAMRTLFAQEMLKNGVMMPWIALSLSHRDDELEYTLNALDLTMAVYRQALDNGIEPLLEGPSIKPVFRSHN